MDSTTREFKPCNGTLFVTFQCPSLAGSGPQIRSASLIRMLAARGSVHVLIVNRLREMPGPCDNCLCLGATAMTYLRILPDASTAGRWMSATPNEVPFPVLTVIDCKMMDLASLIAQYARQHLLNQLFVFRLETLSFIQGCLEFFPKPLLDLDELPSRRDGMIAALRKAPPDPMEKRAQLAARVMEKNLLPRFSRVFVASDREAEQVYLQIGRTASVLPNIRPLPSPVELGLKPETSPCEILFVGVVSYFPNQDGILWFAREILPLLRQKKNVRFRVIGFGDQAGLASIQHAPDVCLSGYQANLVSFYARAATVVVPLRAGSGTRLKILEAFAHRRPVVSTTIGAEGLKVTHGENILLADTPAAFAEACYTLMEQPGLALRLVKNALHLCQHHYSEAALLHTYETIMGKD